MVSVVAQLVIGDVLGGRAALRRHVRSRALVSTVPAQLLDNAEIVDEVPWEYGRRTCILSGGGCTVIQQ